MTHTTQAILISRVSFGEKSQILGFITRDYGRVGCFVKNAFTKSQPASRLQVLTGAEIVFSLKDGRELATLYEKTVTHPRQAIYQNVVKTAVAFFIAEITARTVRQNLQPDDRLYSVLEHFTGVLEAGLKPATVIPLEYTLSFIDAIGHKPVVEKGEPSCFNLVEGVIGPVTFGLHAYEGSVVKHVAHWYLHGRFQTSPTKTERQEMLIVLLSYLDHQLGEPLGLKSPEVLKEVFQ